MAVVAISRDDVIGLSGVALALLMERALQLADREEDVRQLREMMFVDALMFDLLDPPQAKRIAGIVHQACQDLGNDLTRAEQGTREESTARLYREVCRRLELAGLAEAGSEPTG